MPSSRDSVVSPSPDADAARSGGPRPAALTAAAVASLGAGVIHLIAAGVHAEHITLARLFVIAGIAQIVVGVSAVQRPRKAPGAGVIVVNTVAVGAWVVSRSAGISWISGLEQAESPGLADTLCAVLGGLAVVGALWARYRPVPARRGFLAIPAVVVAALVAPAAWSVTDHQHDHGDADAAHDHNEAGGHGDAQHSDATATEAPVSPAASPSTTHGHAAQPATSDTAAAPTGDTAPSTVHQHEASPSAAVPYDPTRPIDLGGVPGVTPQQQAAAENIVAETVIRLPQWADYHTAEAAGFHSIGDALTGVEHFVQWDWINDDITLNPNFPESLVYEPQPDGSKRLVSAMYMLPATVALADVPDIGGPLMQWHIHDNLCFSKDPVAPKVRGMADANGNCPPRLQKFPSAAMIHVWITPNKCGPFAALEGIGAGQVITGEDRACDEAHGSH